MPAQKFYPLISIVLDCRKQIFWLSSEMAISNIGMRSMQEFFFRLCGLGKWNLIGGIQFLRWPTTVTAKQKVTALQTLLTAKQN